MLGTVKKKMFKNHLKLNITILNSTTTVVGNDITVTIRYAIVKVNVNHKLNNFGFSYIRKRYLKIVSTLLTYIYMYNICLH